MVVIGSTKKKKAGKKDKFRRSPFPEFILELSSLLNHYLHGVFGSYLKGSGNLSSIMQKADWLHSMLKGAETKESERRDINM